MLVSRSIKSGPSLVEAENRSLFSDVLKVTHQDVGWHSRSNDSRVIRCQQSLDPEGCQSNSPGLVWFQPTPTAGRKAHDMICFVANSGPSTPGDSTAATVAKSTFHTCAFTSALKRNTDTAYCVLAEHTHSHCSLENTKDQGAHLVNHQTEVKYVLSTYSTQPSCSWAT